MQNNNNTTTTSTHFDIDRFIDVTTPRQLQNGTTTFLDSRNPGVFYSSHTSGYVRRIVKESVTVVDVNEGAQTFVRSSAYQINPRRTAQGKNTTVMINRANDRLRRIQEAANSFTRNLTIDQFTDNNKLYVTHPYNGTDCSSSN